MELSSIFLAKTALTPSPLSLGERGLGKNFLVPPLPQGEGLGVRVLSSSHSIN